MKVIVAEKPSVAAELATIVKASKKEDGFFSGNGYAVTWCFGHLVENAEPAQYDPELKNWKMDMLPIIPASWKLEVIQSTKKQFNVIQKLFCAKDTEEIICAGDCGREGELIFRLVYQKSGCSKPVKRLWVSSLEEKELRRGLADLRPAAEFDHLYEAAACRSRADWLVGINLSRLYSLTYRHPLHVGRVQTPTVALIVRRQQEINHFIPTPFWVITADLGGWKATTKADRTDDAQRIVNACNHKPAYVSKLTQESKKTKPPKLYSITELQKEANRILGYTAQQTLSYLQALYEKKLTTYPRTECQYLPSDMLEGLPDRLKTVLELPCLGSSSQTLNFNSPNYQALINDEKQTDHHAIIPTGTPDDNLPEPEKNILRLVAFRFLAALSPAQEYAQTTVILDIEGEAFRATGKKILQQGYQEVIQAMKRELKGVKEEQEAADPDAGTIPAALKEGDTINDDIAVFSVERKTTPPKPFTDDTLLSSMANVSQSIGDKNLKAAIKDLGLGTGATRANIIETIIKSGYVKRDGRNLISTEEGEKLIEIVAADLTQPEMTAAWEDQLERIASGQQQAAEFMKKISDYVKFVVEALKDCEPLSGVFADSDDRPTIGACPRCGKRVLEYPKSFSCESGKGGCGFSMWKEDRFFTSKNAKLGAKTAADLLKTGKAKVKGLHSEKTGRDYDATVLLADTGVYINYKLDFGK